MQVERLASISHLKDALPIADLDVSFFGCPPGWVEECDESSRRRKRKWLQRDPQSGGVVREVERRLELEMLLEAEASAAGGAPWLGQLIGGEWQIQPRAVVPALTYIFHTLAACGLVSAVEPAASGKATTHWVVNNTYHRGVAFPRAPRLTNATRAGRAPEEEPEELADIEVERLRNIERNKEILRQLGLA